MPCKATRSQAMEGMEKNAKTGLKNILIAQRHY
jgi:hypothetical protein